MHALIIISKGTHCLINLCSLYVYMAENFMDICLLKWVVFFKLAHVQMKQKTRIRGRKSVQSHTPSKVYVIQNMQIILNEYI